MIEELKTFIEVVKYENFTKAAKKVNLSQPTVSLHIKRLESTFDTILIQRSNKSKTVVITPEGRLLYEKGIELLKTIDTIRNEISQTSSQTRKTLRVGASLTIGDYLLPEVLSKFAEINPDVDIEVSIENTAAICKKVNALEVDIGLIEGETDQTGLKKHYFYEDHMILVGANGSPLTRPNVRMSDLKNQVWISREVGSGTQEYLKSFLERNQIAPKRIMVFSSNYAVKEAVRKGLGVTIISEYVVEHALKDKELSIVPLEVNEGRRFSCILPENKKNSETLEHFIEVLELCVATKKN